MTSIRHTFTKAGLVTRAIRGLRRIFNVFAGVFKSGGKIPSLKKPESQLSNSEYHLTASQMRRIIVAAKSSRDKLILQILAETGLRRAEITAIDVGDIKYNELLLFVRQGKGNKTRLVPITPALKGNLKEFIGQRRYGPVFVSSRDRRLSVRQLNRLVAGAGKAAGIASPNPKYRQITPHLFRHSFARLWKDGGGEIEALSKILGHKSTRTTWDFYGTMSLDDIRSSYRKFMLKQSSPSDHTEMTDNTRRK
jgi:integrase/recombinase XerD